MGHGEAGTGFGVYSTVRGWEGMGLRMVVEEQGGIGLGGWMAMEWPAALLVGRDGTCVWDRGEGSTVRGWDGMGLRMVVDMLGRWVAERWLAVVAMSVWLDE